MLHFLPGSNKRGSRVRDLHARAWLQCALRPCSRFCGGVGPCGRITPLQVPVAKGANGSTAPSKERDPLELFRKLVPEDAKRHSYVNDNGDCNDQ